MGEFDLHVFAMRILAFSSRFGQLVPIVLSRIKPTFDFNERKMSCGEERTFVEIRVCELASNLLDDLDVLQICRALAVCQWKDHSL